MSFQQFQHIIDQNLVRYAELIPNRNAFIDARTPGSNLKDNYCIIGPGVTKNSHQHVHIRNTHGFNIGAAGQPPGIKNSLHSHSSAEIFIVFKGTFRFYWGNDGSGETSLSAGDIISIPVNLFRGFEVTGREYGFMYSVLGEDDAGGGVLWHPSAIKASQGYGMYLKNDGSLADTVAGDAIPATEDLIKPLTKSELAKFDQYSTQAMLRKVVFRDDYRTIKPDFPGVDYLQFALIGHEASNYNFQVHGHDHVSVFAYSLQNHASLPWYKRAESQALINVSGDTMVSLRQENEAADILLTKGDVFSVPDAAALKLTNQRENSFLYAVISSDKPKIPEVIL